jgi:hypothetical protein
MCRQTRRHACRLPRGPRGRSRRRRWLLPLAAAAALPFCLCHRFFANRDLSLLRVPRTQYSCCRPLPAGDAAPRDHVHPSTCARSHTCATSEAQVGKDLAYGSS